MSYLVDTCTISDLFKKVPEVIHRFENTPPRKIHLSTITFMEIEYGLKLNPEKDKKIRPLWEGLLKCIEIISYCSHCASATAALRASLKSSGQPIGPFDILIAGTALTHNLVLVTSNVNEFKRIPEVSIEDWRKRTF